MIWRLHCSFVVHRVCGVSAAVTPALNGELDEIIVYFQGTFAERELSVLVKGIQYTRQACDALFRVHVKLEVFRRFECAIVFALQAKFSSSARFCAGRPFRNIALFL